MYLITRSLQASLANARARIRIDLGQATTSLLSITLQRILKLRYNICFTFGKTHLMTYQVLARKWRPQQFKDLIGQETIVQALSHALNNQRLHHAYLFTGTRGVGKTTIARIIAKCLNCEEGISATPCGKCSTCVSIENGRFVDLIEVDAASKTKVEDTRELLDNVMYAPNQGRYKVYLIDEVHMLSGHSFNALLKTLEEPPEHVKFLLATTDPQKLPVTVLSRCLQFQLKALTPTLLAPYLAWILEQEKIASEEQALALLSQAAKGSVRDALSLLDQAIAAGGGEVKTQTIHHMLGVQGQHLVLPLARSVLTQNTEEALNIAKQLSGIGADFDYVLSQLTILFHDLSIKQLSPNFTLQSMLASDDELLALSKTVDAADLQLCYQIALLAKRDLYLAPAADIGFQMALLRMIAFRIESSTQDTKPAVAPKPATMTPNPTASPQKTMGAPPWESQTHASLGNEKKPEPNQINEPVAAKPTQPSNLWHEILPQLGLTALTKAFAEHLHFDRKEDNHFHFSLPETHTALLQDRHRQKLNEALAKFFSTPIGVTIHIGKTNHSQPSMVEHKKETHAQQTTEALAKFQQDPQLQKIVQSFDAKMLPDSLQLNSSLENNS